MYEQYDGLGAQWGYRDINSDQVFLLGHRYYNTLYGGQFLTRDPIGYGGGINLYGYTGNNPINRADPQGTQSIIGVEDCNCSEPDNGGSGFTFTGDDGPFGPYSTGGVGDTSGGGFTFTDGIGGAGGNGDDSDDVGRVGHMGGNQSENDLAERIADEEGLTDEERGELHNNISKQGLSEAAIRREAKAIRDRRKGDPWCGPRGHGKRGGNPFKGGGGRGRR